MGGGGINSPFPREPLKLNSAGGGIVKVSMKAKGG